MKMYASLSVLSFINISTLQMINIRLESNCCNFLNLMRSTGSFKIKNFTMILVSASSSVNMTQFNNISGLIDISDSQYYYLGSVLLDIVAIDVRYCPFGAVSIVDTEFYRVAVATDFACGKQLIGHNDDSVFIMDNVLINSSYCFGLKIQTVNSDWPCYIAILNSKIERVNGIALSMRLDNHHALIRNLTVSLNYEEQEQKSAFIIIEVPPNIRVG